MENRVECALKPSGHACDQSRTNDASNDVFTQPAQDSTALRVGGCPVLTPLPIYRPPAAAFSHRSGPDSSLPRLYLKMHGQTVRLSFHFQRHTVRNCYDKG